MAKKKTENIKAAPVLRAGNGGGEQPTPTPEQTGTRTYQIMDPWKDRGAVNLVDVKAVDGEITEVKVNGVPAGGGGGGGTAQVTFINNGSKPYELPLPYLDEGGYAKGDKFTLFPNESIPATVFLGPQGCLATFDDFPTTGSATGGVRYNDGEVNITGDGTLTVA